MALNGKTNRLTTEGMFAIVPPPSLARTGAKPRTIGSGRGYTAQQLQNSALARAVMPDNPKGLTASDVEADIAQGPEIALMLPAAK
jgi:hypothetical protein